MKLTILLSHTFQSSSGKVVYMDINDIFIELFVELMMGTFSSCDILWPRTQIRWNANVLVRLVSVPDF